MAAPRFHPLTISAIRHPSNGSVALSFAIPADLQAEFSFVPGQYLTLRADVDGEDVRRSYSICSAQGRDALEVGIKRVKGGRFSNFAQSLAVGDSLQVMPPQGRFTAALGGTHNYLLLAAGSGITPCLSIAKSVLAAEAESTITLVYGNSSTATVMFLNDVNDLKDRYTDRFQVFHALSREPSDMEFLNGRLNGEMLGALCSKGLIELDHFDATYICGPQSMTENLQASLVDLGMTGDQVKTELFGTEQSPAAAATASTDPDIPEGAADVAIILDGKRNSVQMDPKAETVLAAAQNAGLDLPFSCAGGMCCTCRCKIVEGEAKMDLNYSLQDWEVEAGFTLACQSRPTSDHLVLDFDAT